MIRAAPPLAAILALALPSAAAADDLSVRTAACANDARFAELGERTAAERRVVARRNHRRAGRLLRLLGQTRRLAAATRVAILAEEPSSADGTRARRLYLVSLRSFDTALLVETAAARRSARSGRADGRSLARAHRSLLRALELERRGTRIFRSLGVSDAAAGCRS